MNGALVAPIRWPGARWYARASLGTARRRAGDDTTALIRRADEAMYEVERAHHARDAQVADAGRAGLIRRRRYVPDERRRFEENQIRIDETLKRGERPEPRLGDFTEGVAMTRYFAEVCLAPGEDGVLRPMDIDR